MERRIDSDRSRHAQTSRRAFPACWGMCGGSGSEAAAAREGERGEGGLWSARLSESPKILATVRLGVTTRSHDSEALHSRRDPRNARRGGATRRGRAETIRLMRCCETEDDRKDVFLMRCCETEDRNDVCLVRCCETEDRNDVCLMRCCETEDRNDVCLMRCCETEDPWGRQQRG